MFFRGFQIREKAQEQGGGGVTLDAGDNQRACQDRDAACGQGRAQRPLLGRARGFGPGVDSRLDFKFLIIFRFEFPEMIHQ